MAYNSNVNAVYFERMKAVAVAAANLAEECKRLRDIHSQQAKPSGVAHDDYDAVDGVTTAEADTFQSFLTDFQQFWEGNGNPAGVGSLAVARWGWALPFYNDEAS